MWSAKFAEVWMRIQERRARKCNRYDLHPNRLRRIARDQGRLRCKR